MEGTQFHTFIADYHRRFLFTGYNVYPATMTQPNIKRGQDADTEGRKHELLRAVQETQRGSAASSDQRAAIEEAIVCVEELGAGEGAPLDLAALDGTWRLCYTSASDVLMLFEAAEKLPLLQVGQIYQKFECKDRSDGGVIRNVVRWSIENLLEVAVENIKISEQLQALIAPAILPRSFLSLQVHVLLRARLQF
ncbi:hypothetical protein ACQ4PT_011778 [Festuca glaucescens]